MASFFVTGSSAGIGRETAQALLGLGHRVVLHARDNARALETEEAVPGAAAVVVGDLASLDQTRAVGEAARDEGPYDAVVHNAGVGGGSSSRAVTVDGLERTFQVNALAPFVLTALMERPARLIYLTSGLQARGTAQLDDLQFARRRWDADQAYCDSKLYDVMLALAVSRHWPGTLSNAVDPGWIKTRMGGPHAPDPLPLGAETQVWLATSDEPAARVTGRFWYRRQEVPVNPAAKDEALQDRFLQICASLSGVKLPVSGRA
ncbi:MAG: SDR family NAD(P)-dependent oxidoreductase [Acidimicrobiales bacterium]|jgi:NAD(P)-dependent dehydrogenase (short-subunit alcohol dehydrogenase family)